MPRCTRISTPNAVPQASIEDPLDNEMGVNSSSGTNLSLDQDGSSRREVEVLISRQYQIKQGGLALQRRAGSDGAGIMVQLKFDCCDRLRSTKKQRNVCSHTG